VHQDLSMPQMASIFGKNARTIRRWCQLGYVRGARCSQGNHWSVRVLLGKKDQRTISLRALQVGGGEHNWRREFAHRVMEKAFDAVHLPRGFERCADGALRRKNEVSYLVRKNGPLETTDPLTGEPIILLPLKRAWEIAAAFEWSESAGAGQSLAPVLDKIKRLGFMPVPKECLSYPMKAELQTALDHAGHKTLFMGFYGAARNTLQATGKCSVAAVCRKLGVSRATAYRHDAAAAVKLAKREFVGVPVVDSVDADD
jgi:hypothetical protein